MHASRIARLLISFVVLLPVTARSESAAFPFEQIGRRAANSGVSDGVTVIPQDGGVLLRAAYQDLEADATPTGLWLRASDGADSAEAPRFQIRATAVGRGTQTALRLESSGVVHTTTDGAVFTRPGINEEYSASMDGVRQDFIVIEKPSGRGALTVALEVTGARVEAATYGAKLILDRSGREIAYHRLHVTDASGRTLEARMEVDGPAALRISVDDAAALYPVRIDPTFCDSDWISMGGAPGVDGSIFAIAADGFGNLYVGGDFTVAGGVAARRVAKWDGSVWTAMGEGLDGQVYALAVDGSLVYAGGIMSGGVACWNGYAWTPLREGVLGSVSALAVSGSSLYVGGGFSQAGGVPASNIAKWQGGNWSALGSGTDSTVTELAVNGADLYVGGSFTSAGGLADTQGIARWNGTSWSALGSGMNNLVNALSVSGGHLYAGGYFTTAGGVASASLARWNLGTSAWEAVGVPPSLVVSFGALEVYGGDLYLAGSFQDGGGPVYSMAKWNLGSEAWSFLPATPNNQVWCFTVAGGQLCVGGNFTRAGEVGAASVARWNGSAWSALGSGFNREIYALASSGTDLYVGGAFTTTPGGPAPYIAKWNGSSWSALGSGTDGPVYALTEWNGSIYAGGDFLTAGGLEANHVARWNPTTSSWSRLVPPVFGTPVGTDATVYALAASATRLYVGGTFSSASGLPHNAIAAWDGASWSTLGSGVFGEVRSLAVSGSSLYAGGIFVNAGGVVGTENIARWDGSAWQALGTSGTNGGVQALAVAGSNLYVGGTFSQIHGVTAANIARWDGSSWSALGSGAGGAVYALAISGTDVFAGGSFTTAGSIGAGHIAKWDTFTESWSALGSGMENPVRALTTGGGRLFAGGDFKTAGGKISPRLASASIARYSDGSLDETFGINGVVVTDFAINPSRYFDIAIQQDGRILVAGLAGPHPDTQYLLARYLPNGDLDDSFGTLGILVTDFVVTSIALQKDGKILVAGSSGPASNLDFALARYLPNGEPDTGFGTAGRITTDFHGGWDQANTVKVQADGKIVLAGFAHETLHNRNVAVARYHTNGLPDLGFDTDGKSSANFGFNSNANDVVVQPNGRIITVGSGDYGFMLVRYMANGVLDGDFGDGGKVITDISFGDNALSVELQADGRIVVAGSVTSSPWLLGLARYTSSGQLDNGFGAGGIVVNESAYAMGKLGIAIQADEKILVPALTEQGAAILRYTPNGSLDPHFGTGGEAAAGLVPGLWSSLALHEDGRIAVAGQSGFDASAKAAIARYAWGPNISLHGNGLEIADGDTTPDPADDTDMGAAPLGGGTSQSFTIRNTGQETLTLTGPRVSISPADGPFSVSTYSMIGSLSPCGGETFFTVNFNPTLSEHVGFQTATVTVHSDDDDENPYTFTVRACGISSLFSDGRLDTGFDSDGKVTTDIGTGSGDFGYAAAEQADGKIVVAGSTNSGGNTDFLLARYRSDGSLDPDFGTGGMVVTPIGTGTDTAHAVVIQPDGKIVVAGSSVTAGNEDFALARYLPEGTLDPSFGSGGRVTTDIGGLSDIAFALALQNDGSIVVAGRSFNGSNQDFAVVCYLPNGAVDATFAGGGGRYNFTGGDDEAREVLVQGDGMIVLAGTSGSDFGLLRLDAYGVLDPAFGSFGKVTTDFGGAVDQGMGAVFVGESKILMAGSSNGSIALARYLPNGSLDPTFGTGGKTTAHSGIANDVALQPDGKIVTGGAFWTGSQNDFLLARFLADGNPDTTFDADGLVTVNLTSGSPNDTANAVLVQCEGRIVLAGTSQNGIDSDIALTRHAVAPMPEIRVEGNLLVIPSFDTTPRPADHTDFGSVGLGDALTRTFTIRNTGSADLHLTGGVGNQINLSAPVGSPFTISAQPASDTIPPGGTVTFDITFSPTAAADIASHSAVVLVPNDDYDEAACQFTITACGVRYSDGTLDRDFGIDGLIRTDFPGFSEVAVDMAFQPDGKVVAAGSTYEDFALARYTPDGILDDSFGAGGMVVTDIAGSDDRINAVAIGPDGRIYVAGQTQGTIGWNAVLACYLPNGSLDPSFGTAGLVVTDAALQAFDVAVQDDGRILLIGYRMDSTTGLDFVLFRFSSSGSPDTTFQGTGMVVTDFAGSSDVPTSLLVMPDGRIVAAGYTGNAPVSDFCLARYLPDGSLDPSFGVGGKVVTDLDGRQDTASALLLQGDKLLLAGFAGPDGASDFAMACYLANGTLDTAFGPTPNGKVVIDFGGSYDRCHAAMVQSDGKIVLAGDRFETGVGWSAALARLLPTGLLDPGFGTNGIVKTSFPGLVVAWHGIGELCDGSLLAVGYAGNGDNNFALARYTWSDGEIAVSGNGVDVTDGDTTPDIADHSDFGSTCAVAGSVERIFTISNSGPDNLNLTGSPRVEITGEHADDFTVTVQPTSPVADGESTTFKITFDPADPGLRTATVSIACNDADEHPFTFAIQGIGLTHAEVFEQKMLAAGLTVGNTAPSATPFGDGVSNLLKYAFNLNLNAPDVRILPAGGTAGLPRITLEGSGESRVLRYEFVGRMDCLELTYTAKKSTDLAPESWLPLEALPQITPIGGEWVRIVYEEPAPVSTTPRLFGRVEVELP